MKDTQNVPLGLWKIIKKRRRVKEVARRKAERESRTEAEKKRIRDARRAEKLRKKLAFIRSLSPPRNPPSPMPDLTTPPPPVKLDVGEIFRSRKRTTSVPLVSLKYRTKNLPKHRLNAKGQRKSVSEAFYERLGSIGLLQEFQWAVRKYAEDHGIKPLSAHKHVMRVFGYEGPEKEWRLHDERWRKQGLTGAQMILKEEREEMRKTAKLLDFTEAVKGLPDKAPVQEEIDWIRGHEAMTRKIRCGEDEPVLLDANDVLRQPHGKAPSKAAVYQLQHWANNPNKFFEMILSEHKKAQDEQAEKKVVKDPGLAEIEAMLASVPGSVD